MLLSLIPERVRLQDIHTIYFGYRARVFEFQTTFIYYILPHIVFDSMIIYFAHFTLEYYHCKMCRTVVYNMYARRVNIEIDSIL